MLSLGAFRSRAVEKIESPEQLDTRIKPAKPGAWIALITLLAAVIVALVWSIVSTVPVSVGGTGFFLPKEGWNSVQAATGRHRLGPRRASERPGGVGGAARPHHQLERELCHRALPVTGYVVEVAVSQQEYVSPGIQMAVIRPLDDTLVVHAYIPTGLAHEIPVGSETEVSPSTVAPSAYGFLKGRVVSVAPFPATQQRLQEVLQNESLVQQVSSSGPVTEVLMSLQPANTPSGYAWSIGHGSELCGLDRRAPGRRDHRGRHPAPHQLRHLRAQGSVSYPPGESSRPCAVPDPVPPRTGSGPTRDAGEFRPGGAGGVRAPRADADGAADGSGRVWCRRAVHGPRLLWPLDLAWRSCG